MQRRQRRRQNAGPLLVTEVILPVNEQPGPSRPCLENANNISTKVQETENTVVGGCLLISSYIKPIGRLISLEKTDLEPYFTGTKQKKVSKRKSKQKQKKNELPLFEESQIKVVTGQGTKTVGAETQRQGEKSPSFIEVIEKNKLKQRIWEYEKFKKQSDRKNQIKQRLAEQNYIENYENLAETWLEFLKRRNQLKAEGFTSFQTPNKDCYYNKRVRISIVPRKFWSQNDITGSPAEKKDTPQKEEVDELNLDKLVFVDDESSN